MCITLTKHENEFKSYDISYAQVSEGGLQQESEKKSIDPITLMLQKLINKMEQQESKKRNRKSLTKQSLKD